MATKIRPAKLSDVWELKNLIIEFRQHLANLGVKTIAKDENVLRGGTVIELGLTFENPNWCYIVAERDGELIGFIVGSIEQCGPTDSATLCMRIHGDYLRDNALSNPRILQKMWDALDKWGKSKGAEYYYCLIHPGNIPSIRTAKYVGFKHHMTQFIRYNNGV